MTDASIRQLLKGTTLKGFFYDPATRVIDEFKLSAANARIDIAVINGHLHGYEIKSAIDTLQRLPGQLKAYEKIFDFVTVVTEDKYHQRLLNTLPPWIGLYVCVGNKNGIDIIDTKMPVENKARQGFYLAKLLWRNELITHLDRLNISYKKNWRNWTLAESLSQNTDLHTLSHIVRETIKQRAISHVIANETSK